MKEKYIKYKKKYLALKSNIALHVQHGGDPTNWRNPLSPTDRNNKGSNLPQKSPGDLSLKKAIYIPPKRSQDPIINMFLCGKQQSHNTQVNNAQIDAIFRNVITVNLKKYKTTMQNSHMGNLFGPISDKIMDTHLKYELNINLSKTPEGNYPLLVIDELKRKITFYKNIRSSMFSFVQKFTANNKKFIIVDNLNTKVSLYKTGVKHHNLLDLFFDFLKNKYPDHMVIVVNDISNGLNYSTVLNVVKKGMCSLPYENFLSFEQTSNRIITTDNSREIKESDISRIMIDHYNLLFPSKYDSTKQKAELDDITIISLAELILLKNPGSEVFLLSGDEYRWITQK